MNTHRAVEIIEGDSDFEDYSDAFQHLIDTGVVWNLKGWYGRTAASMITDGYCTDTHDVLGANPHHNS
jgi:hypothetical protein